jgi:glycosyltransferase involved in cell wall biosynthesis
MISILMPIFNGIEFIEESVTSVLNQTYKEWELIIGINGHTKNSEVYKTALKYVEKNKLQEKKIIVKDLFTIRGKAEALNEMVKYCKYDYIAILDVDDIWHPKKLEIQIPFCISYDVIGTKCVYIGDNNLVGIIPDIPEGDFTDFDFTKFNPIINSSAIVRKIYAYWNPKWFGIEDYDLWLSLRVRKCQFYNCSKVAVKHRIHAASAFNSKGNAMGVKELVEFWKKLL